MSGARVLYDIIARDHASKTFLKVGEAATSLEMKSAKVGAAISKGLKVGTLATGALAAASVHAATKFESSMTKVSTQAGATHKDVKILGDQVLKLGGTAQQGPEQLADSLYHLKSVGMDNVDAMKALKTASDLAAVGGADLEATTNALAGAWRTGIKGATSFGDAAATVNSIIGAGNMTMEDFTDALASGILPTAKTFGLTLTQVGSALALFTDEGVPASDAATRLRMSISLLGAPSGAAEKQLHKIGLTGLDLAKAMRSKDGIIGAIQLLKDHLDKSGLSAAQQSQILSRAFGGGKSSSGILSMISNLDVLKLKQDQVNKSTGKYADAVATQRRTAEAQWKRLTSGLESMSVRLGGVLLPPVTSFVGFLNDKAMPAVSHFGSSMARLVPTRQIADDFSTVRGMVSDFFGGLQDSGKTGLEVPIAAAKPSKALPPSAVAHGLSPAPAAAAKPKLPANIPPSVAAHGLIPQNVAPPPSAAKKLGETIRDSISKGISGIDWGKLGGVLGKGLGDALGYVGKHTADFTKKIAEILGGMDFVSIGKGFGAQAIPLAIGFITSLFDPLFSLDFWKKHWLDTIIAVVSVVPIGRLAGGLTKVFEHLPFLKIFSPLLKGVSKLGGWLEKGFGKVFGPLRRGIADGFKKAFPAAEGILRKGVDRFVLRPLGRLKEIGRLAPRWLADGIERGTSWVTQKILGLVKTVTRPFARAGSWLVSKGSELTKGFTRGIVSGAKGVGSFAWRWVGKPVVDGFKGAGSWLWSKGKSVASGFKSGITSGAKAIGSFAWRHIGKPVVDGFKGAGSWLWSKGKWLASGFKSGMTSGAKAIGSFGWRTIGKPTVDAFKGAGSWLWSSGKWLVGGLKSGAVSGAKGIAGFSNRTVIKPLVGAFKGAASWLKSAGGHLLTGLKDGVVGGIKGIGSWLKKNLVDPVVNAVKHWFGIRSPSRVFMGIGGHLVSGLVKGMATTSGKAIAHKVFGDMPSALGHLVKKGLVSVSKLPGKALSALKGLGSKLGGFFSGLFGGGSSGGGVSRWSGAVKTVLGLLGAPASALGPVLTRIGIESGGNPDAINLTDSNARAGHPSQGLMQTIPSTFNAYAGPFRSRGITDGLASIYAGVNYAMHRYGSNWISVMTRSGGYAKGTGGAAKGLAWVGERGAELVNFGGGEQVLSHPDSMAFAKAHGIRVPGYASGTIMNASDRVHRDRKAVEDAKDAVARAKRRRKGVAAAETKLRAAQKELKAAEIALANAKRSAKTQISNAIATGLVKKLATGTSASITSAIKSVATKLLNAGYNGTAKAIQKKGASLEALADKRTAVQKKIAAANQYATDQASGIRDFLSISGTSASSVKDLISQATGQQKTASGFVALSKSLKARGASKDLLQQLSDAGPGSQLATILSAKNVTTTDIAKLNKLMSGGNKLATSFGRDMADLMFDSGKDAGKGFLAGLKGQEKELGKQMAKMATDLVKQIKKALKIKSPSGVFRDQVGKQIALGMVVGMDRHRPHIAAAAQRMAVTARNAAVLPSLPARQSAAFDRLSALLASGQAGGTEIHVHFDDPTLKDLIRAEAKPLIKASETTTAYRAKVGRR